MKTIRIVLIHIICWTVILGYLYGGYLLKEVSFSAAALEISINIIQIVEFYICFLWVFPNYLKRDKIIQLIAGLIVAMVAFIALRYLIEEVLYLHLFGIHNYSLDTTIFKYALNNIYYGTSFIVIAAAVYGVQNAIRSEQANRELKEEVVKAELSFLKSQINPHFLYNTLNYVYSLAIPVSDEMANAVLSLSDLMRYTLSDGADGKVKLIREVAYIKKYIELFKMRFDPHFYVQFNEQGMDENHEVTPLLLIPFVENAFKHGVVNDIHYPIKISLLIENNTLTFSVSNKINDGTKDYSNGIGLTNIKRRLQLIYPKQHQLTILNDDLNYQSILTINLSSIN